MVDPAVMPFRVLFIDAYDSFTNNIISLIETRFGVVVTTVKIDDQIPNFAGYLKLFHAVIAGPGPGHPGNPADVGLMKQIWELSDVDLVPVLGICLGFQSMVLAFGGSVQALPQPIHGLETLIHTDEQGIFDDLPTLNTIQYHSLYASIDLVAQVKGKYCLPDEFFARFKTPNRELKALAFHFGWGHNDATFGQFANNPQYMLMAVKHVRKPFWGIQFHPESISSDFSATQVIDNWWREVNSWHEDWQQNGMMTECWVSELLNPPFRILATSASAPGASGDESDIEATTKPSCSPLDDASPVSSAPSSPPPEEPFGPDCAVHRQRMRLNRLTVPRIVEILGVKDDEVIVLDSELRLMPVVGDCSIIGLILPDTLIMSYNIGSGVVEHRRGNDRFTKNLHGASIFSYLKSFMADHILVNEGCNVGKFRGGLMGYITYEACLETINVPTSATPRRRPDLCFAFIERSLLLEHDKKMLYIQTIRYDDVVWSHQTRLLLRYGKAKKLPPKVHGLWDTNTTGRILDIPAGMSADIPTKSSYQALIRSCRAHIQAGNSYELCLTRQAKIRTAKENSPSSWERYLELRQLNPAPFSAYVRLGPLTLLSTSPERFMDWSCHLFDVASNEWVSTCQFRPIKGTVDKVRSGNHGSSSKEVTFEEASALLSAPKEQAENLMIVDLIRHDLYSVVGSGNVTVPSLMYVEEYERVYQLVSIIEGKLRTAQDPFMGGVPTGLDILAASLPPGSMTGAPKKRSCELLKEIEGEERSIYSGVLGYIDVGGEGDFSVVIRSVFKWDEENDAVNGMAPVGGENNKEGIEEETEEWRIGAGGAVTGLSTEEGEWEEMMAKMRSTLAPFMATQRRKRAAQQKEANEEEEEELWADEVDDDDEWEDEIEEDDGDEEWEDEEDDEEDDEDAWW